MFALQLPLAGFIAAGLCIATSPSNSPLAESAANSLPAESRTELPEGLIELLPANTSAVFAAESISAWDDLEELGEIDFDELRLAMDQLMFGLLSAGYVDDERPLVWAIGEPSLNGPPATTVVLPLIDGVDEASLPLQDFEGFISFRVIGGYIGLHAAPEYPETGVDEALFESLRIEPFGVGVNVEIWMEYVGPLVSFGLSQLREEAKSSARAEAGSDEGELVYELKAIDVMMDLTEDLFESAGILTMDLGFDGSLIEFALGASLIEGSPMSELAEDVGVSIEDCIHMLGVSPVGGFAIGLPFQDLLDPLGDLVEESLEDGAEGMTEESAAAMAQAYNGMITILDCSPTAISGPFALPGDAAPGALILHGADSSYVVDGILDIYAAIEIEVPGIPATLEHDGSNLNLVIRLLDDAWEAIEGDDPEARERMASFFGDSFDLSISDDGERTICTMETDGADLELLEDAISGEGGLSRSLREIESRLEGAYPFAAIHVDMKEMLLGAGALAKLGEELDDQDDQVMQDLSDFDSEDTTLTMYFGVRPDYLSAGFSIDIMGTLGLAEVMGE